MRDIPKKMSWKPNVCIISQFIMSIMVFAFSMGILSPYVGRKEIVSIILIGFVLGAIGGYFFIDPIYEESPYIIGNVQGLFTLDSEVIYLNIPSTMIHFY